MVKKYTDNYRLDIAYTTIFRNLEPIEEISIHNALNITSGDNLTKKDMVSGTHIVYGGGGETGNTHSEFNVDYKTIGIGRVGARCGCVFEIIPNSWVTDNALMIQSYDKRFSLDFLRHFLSYSDLGQYANNAMQPVISKTRIKDVNIPLIDIQEQNALSKILDSIEKNEKFESNDYDLLKSKIKIIDNWESLNVEIEIQNDLTAQLKQSIFQEAIQGKLTTEWRTQNPNTDSASELLKRIKEEKTQLIKDKKIKKEKALPPITAEEIPFEIPESWVWCRLGEISEYVQRGKSPKYVESSSIPVISQKCVQWDRFDFHKARFINENTLDKYGEERFLKDGDLLWNSTGDGTVGRIIEFINTTSFEKVVVDSHVAVVRLMNSLTPKFVLSYLSTKEVQDNLIVSGSTKQTELSKGTVLNHLIPLAPEKEQKAIVEKVEALMQKHQALEEEIKISKADAQILMQAVLKEAFEGKKEEVCQD